jgi:hypothetical protein
LRREHDDEPGDARHDDTGQRHGRRGNAGRITCIAIGLLKSSGPKSFFLFELRLSSHVVLQTRLGPTATSCTSFRIIEACSCAKESMNPKRCLLAAWLRSALFMKAQFNGARSL